MFTAQNGLKMLGNHGLSDSDTTDCAVYGRNMRDAFMTDALTLGMTVDCIDSGVEYVRALDEKGLVAGEFDNRDGGMLAWSI